MLALAGALTGAAALVARARRTHAWQREALTVSVEEVRVRVGGAGDMEGVAELVRALAAFEGSEDKVQTDAESLRRDFAQGQFMIAVAVRSVGGADERELVGFALYSFGYSTWAGRTLALDDLFVRENFRGSGVGSQLLKFVARAGQEAGCNRMEWFSFKWNGRANGFYASRGAERQDELYYWRLSHENMALL